MHKGFGVESAPVKILLNNGTGLFSYTDYNSDGLTDVFIQEGGMDQEPYPVE